MEWVENGKFCSNSPVRKLRLLSLNYIIKYVSLIYNSCDRRIFTDVFQQAKRRKTPFEKCHQAITLRLVQVNVGKPPAKPPATSYHTT